MLISAAPRSSCSVPSRTAPVIRVWSAPACSQASYDSIQTETGHPLEWLARPTA